MTRHALFAAGTSTGISGAALVELLRSLNWANVLAFGANVVVTAIGWYVAARAARRDEDRKDREEQRQQRLEDWLQEQRMKEAARNVEPVQAAVESASGTGAEQDRRAP